MEIDLVTIPTSDRLQLPAAFFKPRGLAKTKRVEAVVLNPGTSGSFYHPVMIGLGDALAGAGYAALAMSTRGHDIVWRDAANGRYLGAAYERIGDCRFDFDAGISWMAARGYSQIGLLGHSLGATKATWYAAHAPDSRLAALINCSGPRWSAKTYLSSDRADAFIACRDKAERLIAEGRGDDIAELEFPLGKTFFTPNGWIEKYGGERFNLSEWAHQITVPLFRIDGENEASLVPRDVGEDLLRLAVESPHRAGALIPGADHFYTGVIGAVAEAIIGWLDGLPDA